MTDRFKTAVDVSFSPDQDKDLLPLAQVTQLARHILKFHVSELLPEETAVQFAMRALDERRGAKRVALN